MIDVIGYSKAYVEVLKIIEMLPDCEYKKIPEKLIENFEKNCDRQYQFKIESEEEFQKRELLEETKFILYVLYRKYLADNNEKEKLKKMEYDANIVLEKSKALKYNTDDLFKKSLKKEDDEQNILNEIAMVESKKSIFKKIWNKILNIIKK